MIFALTLLSRRMQARREAASRAALLRVKAEALMDQASEWQAQADADYHAATLLPPECARRGHLECRSHERACLSMACVSEAGGDHTTARLHREAAAWWRERARQYAAAVEMDHA